MSTYVGDPLYVVCEFLQWRDIIHCSTVNKDFHSKCKVKNRDVLRRLARRQPNMRDIPSLIPRGLYIWHPVWDGPYRVWTPEFPHYKLTERGPQIVLPINLEQDWTLWIMALKRHLNVTRSARWAQGKRHIMHRTERYKALIAFRLQNQFLSFRIVRLKQMGRVLPERVARRIYKRRKTGRCATQTPGS